MRLSSIRVQNFRSIRDSGTIRIEPLQAFVGENNCGKSNLLKALQCFLTSGAGGMAADDFNDVNALCAIECEFSELSEGEKRRLRPYIIGDKVVLRKELHVQEDKARGRTTVRSDYHGYQAEPRDEWLSVKKLSAGDGRPKWQEIAKKNGILEYVQGTDGKVNKASYEAGLKRYLEENDVEYDEPELGETQALGLPQNLLSALPEIYLLPAITDYSDEIDRRSSSTVFRRLMADLSERIIGKDPRHIELEEALERVRALLNFSSDEGAPRRLEALSAAEVSLRDVMKKLMPSVASVKLEVQVEAPKEIFGRGVAIRIDDGVLTDVLDKGHGMQRNVVFSLLQMLIDGARLRDGDNHRPIILAIEEPELYIHPQSQRLIFRVLREFAGSEDDDAGSGVSDQVIYTTHSPSFVEVWNYQRIGIVSKPDARTGTIVTQAARLVLGSPEDRKSFKTLTSFGLKHNEVFFSRYAIIVEGPEDEVGFIATARKLGIIEELPDEMSVSIIVASGKGDVPKFQRIMNAFDMNYSVLLEMDGHNDAEPKNAAILEQLNGNRVARLPNKLEDLLGLPHHFKDQHHAKQFFSEAMNINAAMEQIVRDLLPLPEPEA
ncbi:ATP-dependent OLD family endonuclease [Glycocaulis alkaliphilus]|uniref:ATP-dependent OLD family endonuclease n=1 Tax=Glycocaulis alkaliphilus TaxID=1434191 RepID=A0A3T0E7A4_9PROT|nr:AAA family ATPase [Glycocaulis alkaliphilus]AZU03253.1 ATP-dependent OLD family endonuclease [Glycocaulis alkaliphilus]GGB72169.1 ATP-dependent endonuclease [Glycocaulis alkaliphilus]